MAVFLVGLNRLSKDNRKLVQAYLTKKGKKTKAPSIAPKAPSAMKPAEPKRESAEASVQLPARTSSPSAVKLTGYCQRISKAWCKRTTQGG